MLDFAAVKRLISSLEEEDLILDRNLRLFITLLGEGLRAGGGVTLGRGREWW
jgi:hypothetical protein